MNLLIDNETPTTLAELLEANPDLPEEEVEALCSLEPGQTTNLGCGGGGFFEAKRVTDAE